MGSRAFHVKRANHHLEVAGHLSGTPAYVDWAAVALFYSAHQLVHSVLSGDPTLTKDERHPRKHTSYGGEGTGGRGTTNLVRDLFPRSVHRSYRSLFEASHRTRYDLQQWDAPWTRLHGQFEEIQRYCLALNATRPDRGTQEH